MMDNSLLQLIMLISVSSIIFFYCCAFSSVNFFISQEVLMANIVPYRALDVVTRGLQFRNNIG